MKAAMLVVLATAMTSLAAEPQIVSVMKIWDQGSHNAFTDLIRFNNKWFCTFRESEAHVGGNGKLRVIVSDDGETWTSAALLSEDGIDLRDPKLSITSDGRLMMTAGGSVYEGKKLTGRQQRVAFSKDGTSWTPTQRILSEGDWMWRVTWHDGRAYGTSYISHDKTSNEKWELKLYVSDDGVKYEHVNDLHVPDRPNETTLRFLKDGRMVAFVRREAGDQHGWIGTSASPYKEWKWQDCGERVGGPNFIVLDDDTMWASSRSHLDKPHAVVARMTTTSYKPVLDLPSGGDCSYPGMVFENGLLWISYYSSHEGKTSIYLAKVKP